MLLQGRTAVVTGGARGIGLAIARLMVDHGANVVLGDLDGDAAGKVAAELGSGVATALRCDVTAAADVDALLAHGVDRFGRVDVMVNNAGITRDATLRTMTEADFDAVIAVHLKGTWLGTRAASLLMREQRSGAIVNISSISGKVGMIGQTNYSAAKAGIVGLTKAAAKELAHHGVRVNAVQPGLIRTEMTESLRADVWEKKVSEVPMQRAGEASEVAGAVVFLASDLSSYITGTITEVSGGRHI